MRATRRPNLFFLATSRITGTTTFTWDTRNRLSELHGPALSASFAYDALGRRIMKTLNGQSKTAPPIITNTTKAPSR